MKNPYLVVKKLMRTEKGTTLTKNANAYVFEVSKEANKIEIKRAVEAIYKVRVRSVNTMIMPRKPKMLRRSQGFRSEIKKAVVRLGEGQQIDLKV